MTHPWQDVSVRIHDGLVHWPGDADCRVSLAVKLGARDPRQRGKVSPCNVTHLSLSAHTGTRMDAPRHFVAKGRTMESLPLDAVIGPCRVIRIKHPRIISVEELRP